ncbi:Hsp90 cochaperone [Martiniozyma asiatica (nom. inval.)]|nr:Hsp90 cochaperone [Martiniozyma asiatica]
MSGRTNLTMPEVLWAQRNTPPVLLITFTVTDVDTNTLSLIPTVDSLAFYGESQEASYSRELKFWGTVSPESMKFTVNGNRVFVEISRKETEYWPRLTKLKEQGIRTDFDHWVDEDEEEEEAGENFNNDLGFDMGDMQLDQARQKLDMSDIQNQLSGLAGMSQGMGLSNVDESQFSESDEYEEDDAED